jgi:hypothetical protein
MPKAISTQLTQPNIEAVLALLSQTPGRLTFLSQQLPPEQLTRPLAAGERSFADNVAHLLHCESRTAEAITLALLLDEPLVLAIHPERQVGKLWRLDELSPADLLTYFALRRTILLKILNGLTPAEWERAIQPEGKKRLESVFWLARALALHEEEHLADLGRYL